MSIHPLRKVTSSSLLKSRMEGRTTDQLHAQELLDLKLKREAKEHTRARFRLALSLMAATFVYGAIGVKMTALALTAPSETQSNYQHSDIYGGRASIVDRSGNILATNLPGYSLYVHPNKLIDAEAAAKGLAKIFPDLKEKTLLEQFHIEGSKFRWLKDQISPEQKMAVLELGEPGLQFGKREMRLFPNGATAAHILGGVNFGEKSVTAAEIKGAAGLEFGFNEFLSDPKNQNRALKLSIDVSVQDALEAELYRGMIANNAKAASAVLMEADTGRVIAMASLPDFDPNVRPKQSLSDDPELDPRFDRAALGTYELGSTFKIFTIAEVLEKGIANPNTVIKVGRGVKEAGHTITDFKFYGEELTLTDVIVKSSNVGTARLARGMGGESQKAFLKKLGLLQPTSLELPEAKKAQPLFPSNWTDIYTMTISYGHGISATPLHLAAAYCAMVNGGLKVEPTLLHELPDDMHRERVISATTSMQIREMLRQVVTRGTASFAQTPGYDIGGKTGTADKQKRSGGYYENRNINTFAAAFPRSDPKYVLVTVLDEPNVPDIKKRTAGWTVVPTSRSIVERIAPLLNVRPIYTPDLPMVAKIKNEVNG